MGRLASPTIIPLLDAQQAADLLGVCTKTLRKIRHRGLPYVTLPSGAIRYKPEDIEDFIEGRTCRSDQKPRATGITTSRSGVVDFMAHAERKTTRKPSR